MVALATPAIVKDEAIKAERRRAGEPLASGFARRPYRGFVVFFFRLFPGGNINGPLGKLVGVPAATDKLACPLAAPFSFSLIAKKARSH